MWPFFSRSNFSKLNPSDLSWFLLNFLTMFSSQNLLAKLYVFTKVWYENLDCWFTEKKGLFSSSHIWNSAIVPSFSSVNWLLTYLLSLNYLLSSFHLFSFLSFWNQILQFLNSSSWIVCCESNETSLFSSCEGTVFWFSWSFFFLCSIPSSVLLCI